MLRTTVAFAGVVLLGASCATCTTDKVVADDEELAVESPVVTFPQTFVGTRSSKTVMLVNRAGGPREATLSVAPPFSVDRRAARLEGGASLTVTVSFEPLEALRYQGGLGVVTGSKELQVELHGEGAELPRCVSENRCVSSGFDPDLLRCSETTLADGTPCSEGCLENASCSRGQCVGTARSCDDMNGCTVDSCSAGGSCVHGQVVDACKKEDPCTSPVCDVDAGIVRVPTADGTPCGPADCQTAAVCLSGSCQTRAVAEGSPCGAPSPCQGPGRCESGACSRPPPTELREVWSYHSDGGVTGTVVDGSNRIYFLELSGGTQYLVALGPSGNVRYRVALASLPVGPNASGQRPLSIAGGGLIVRTGEAAFSMHRPSDGQELWGKELRNEVPWGQTPSDWPAGYVDNTRLLERVVSGPPGILIASVGRWAMRGLSGQMFGSYLIAVDSNSSATLWVRADATVEGLIADAQGNLFFRASNFGPPGARLTSLSATGGVRWQVPYSWYPLAVEGTDLVTYGSVSLALDGGQTQENPIFRTGDGTIVGALAIGGGLSASSLTPCQGFHRWYLPSGDALLSALPRHDAGVDWTMAVPGDSSFQVTDDGAVMILESGGLSPDKPIRVTGTSGGVERFRCESALTRGPGSYGGIVAILDDHLLAIRLVASASASPVMSLHLLHLPGVRPARVGWHGPQGRSEGDFRPR